MMIRIFFRLALLIGMLLLFSETMAQRSFSVSAGGGTSYYYGDLTDQFNNSLIRPAGGMYLDWYVDPSISLRLGLHTGMVGAADSLANSSTRTVRNLSFRSPLREVSLTGVWHIIPDERFGRRWMRRTRHTSPFVFAGVAYVGFDPQTQWQGEWVRLQPLGTEGQLLGEGYPAPYDLWQVAIPFGAGLEVRVSRSLGIQWELGYRKTFTDYLDDVSTVFPDQSALLEAGGDLALQLSDRSGGYYSPGDRRGNPGAKDSYFFSTLSVTYYLPRKEKTGR